MGPGGQDDRRKRSLLIAATMSKLHVSIGWQPEMELHQPRLKSSM